MGVCHSQEEWFDAARRNDVDTINRLGPSCITLREERDVPEQYIYHNFTAMMNAAYFGHSMVLDLLVVDEYKELLEEPVSITIMTFKEVMVHSYPIPADFSPFELSLLSESVECFRMLCGKYLVPENADLLQFNPPNDVISLLAISANEGIWAVVVEYFRSFVLFVFPELSCQHLQIAVEIGNSEFIETVLRMANSAGICKFAVRAIKQYNSRINAHKISLPDQITADDTTQDQCRQLLIGYMLGERIFPVPAYMGGPLPEPRFSIRKFVETQRQRGSLNLEVLRQQEQNQLEREQVFRVESCGDLHVTPHMHRTGSGFFNIDGETCDVTGITDNEYEEAVDMIEMAGYISLEGEVINQAQNVSLRQSVGSPIARASLTLGMPEIRLTADQWRESVDVQRDELDISYEDSRYDDFQAPAVGKMIM